MKRFSQFTANLCTFAFLGLSAFAQPDTSDRSDKTYPVLSPAGIFGDNMVLQRDRPVVIWGNAAASSQVEVAFGKQKKQATTNSNQIWRVTLEPMPANATGAELTITATQRSSGTIRFGNVLVGDVWHASGQSNMGWNMGSVAKRIPEAVDHIEQADLPAIRYRRINTGDAAKPTENLAGGTWSVCSPQTVSGYSGVAFYYARALHRELKVPVGIINTARGGTPIEPFIPRAAFTGHPVLEREAAFGDADDLEGIWKMPGGVRARSTLWLPGRLYNTRIHPFRQFALRGSIWYQGESNSGKGEDPRAYEHKQRALFNGWRSAFGHADMPCYFVQLPGSGGWKNWPYLREQQRLAMAQKHTGMAVTIDLVDSNIHPPNKFDVGERLARWALAKTYDRPDTPFSGPLFSKTQPGKDGRLSVHFDHAEGLMLAKKTGFDAPVPDPELKLGPVEVADAAGRWFKAEATISGETLVVRSAMVSEPVAVRYGYAPDPRQCHLYNRHGLPAAPFCSKPDLLVASPDIPTD